MSKATEKTGNSLAQLLDCATLAIQALVDNGGELTPEFEKHIALNEQLIAEKVDRTEFVLKRLEAEAAFLKERASEFAAAAKARSNAVERIRERIKQLMLTYNQTEIAGEYVRFVLSPSIPSLVIDNEVEIPAEFVKTVTTQKCDNAAIKLALQSGTPVPGAHLEECHQLRTYTAANIKKVGAR